MGQVWFGTRKHMQWITAPAVDIEMTKSGYRGSTNFTSGGAWVRRSKVAAKRYPMSWNVKPRVEIQPILDYADGIYGDGAIYYCDPFAMDRNILPSWLAAPFQNAYDGPWTPLGLRPRLQDNGMSTGGYPTESAIYEITSATPLPEVYIPIPPGHTAHIGVHGAVLSGGVSVLLQRYIGPSGGELSSLPLMPITSQMTSTTVSGDSYQGFGISMASPSSGSIRLDGLIAQILPSDKPAPVGNFIAGQGSSGLSFLDYPAVIAHSAALDHVSATVDLIETEAWS